MSERLDSPEAIKQNYKFSLIYQELDGLGNTCIYCGDNKPKIEWFYYHIPLEKTFPYINFILYRASDLGSDGITERNIDFFRNGNSEVRLTAPGEYKHYYGFYIKTFKLGDNKIRRYLSWMPDDALAHFLRSS